MNGLSLVDSEATLRPAVRRRVADLYRLSLRHGMTHMPTLNITLSLPQDEIDTIR